MALLLLCLNWFSWYALCRELAARGHIHSDWRVSWMLACVAWGMLLVVIVEASSLAHTFTAPVIATAWVSSAGILASLAARLAWCRGAWSTVTLHAWCARLQQRGSQPWPTDARLMLVGTGLLILTLGGLAITLPTTNWDSMTYHMARVMHWIQDQSVAHYPTTNGRQLESGPWAEFGMATLYLLQGNDQYVNLIQWCSMLCSVIAASLVAQQLLPGWAAAAASRTSAAQPGEKTRRRITAMTCILVATLPIGVLEALTTQNDYATTCWLTCLMSMALALTDDPANPWYTVGAAGALALGVLTKVTMVLFATLLIGVLVLVWFVLLRQRVLRPLLVLVVIFGALNAPHMARNYAVYGSPLGSRGTFKIQRSRDFSLGGITSNVIRNLSLHTATGFAPLTRNLNNLILLAHSLTGKSLNYHKTTFPYTPFQFQEPSRFGGDESAANNPYHLGIIGMTLLMLLLTRHAWWQRLRAYNALVIGSFILFCAYLRWQPWHSRFHLAYFVLLMPSAAIVCVTMLPRWCNSLLAMALFSMAYVCLFYNGGAPINTDSDFITLPREQQYFAYQRALYTPYAQVADEIITSGCQQVGLKLDYESWEYPFWVLLHNRGFKGSLHHVYVTGEAAQIHTAVPASCAVIVMDIDAPPELVRAMPRRTSHSPLTVYWSMR